MRALLMASIAGILVGYAPAPAKPDVTATPGEQRIVVRPAHGAVFQVEVTAQERRGDESTDVVKSRPGVIGPKGFAPPGEKREGDGRTPTGVFRIGTAFGYEPSINTKLAYRQTTADDFWVDDPGSPQYNRWIHGKPEAKSFEKLRIDAYRYAAAVEYNTDPVVPGHGSAIFLHVWSGPDKPTSGCVALAEADVKKLLGWLDKRRHPAIVLNP